MRRSLSGRGRTEGRRKGADRRSRDFIANAEKEGKIGAKH
jgi:hypothetical protein